MSDELQVLIEGRDEIPVEEEKENEGPTQEELKAEFERIQQENAMLKAQADSAAKFESGLEKLGEKLAPQQMGGQQQVNIEEQQKSFEEWKKKANKDFYKDPIGSVINLQTQKLMPEIQKALNNSMQVSRELCRLNEETRESFGRYAAEVDEEVSKLPPIEKNDIQVYQKTLEKVKAKHIDEIVQEKVQKALEKMQEEQNKNVSSSPVQHYSEVNVNPRTKPVKVEVMTKEEYADAIRKGFGNDPEKYWRIIHGK